MKRYIQSFLLVLMGLFSTASFAADSYRWLHVTIDTPWAIFIFLLPMVLIPVVLMAILYWRFAGNKSSTTGASQEPVSKAAEKE